MNFTGSDIYVFNNVKLEAIGGDLELLSVDKKIDARSPSILKTNENMTLTADLSIVRYGMEYEIYVDGHFDCYGDIYMESNCLELYEFQDFQP